jgi:hypothetical protein
LIEALLIHETYFFPHPDQWPLLMLAARRSGAPLVAWSAGCSTGEEAWSLLLAREGHRGSVVGTDLSEGSIATAAARVYRRLERMGSIREMPDFAELTFPPERASAGTRRHAVHRLELARNTADATCGYRPLRKCHRLYLATCRRQVDPAHRCALLLMTA